MPNGVRKAFWIRALRRYPLPNGGSCTWEWLVRFGFSERDRAPPRGVVCAFSPCHRGRGLYGSSIRSSRTFPRRRRRPERGRADAASLDSTVRRASILLRDVG